MKTDGTELEQVVHHIEDCSGAVAVADPGKGPGGGAGSPLFFWNKLGSKGPKNPYLRVGMTASSPPPPPSLMVCIRQWGWVGGFDDPNPSLQSWIFTSVLAGCK